MRFSQLVQSKIGDLEYESRVNEAIARLEIAMAAYLRGVKVSHASYYIVNQRASKYPVQFHLFVLKDILWIRNRYIPSIIIIVREKFKGYDFLFLHTVFL